MHSIGLIILPQICNVCQFYIFIVENSLQIIGRNAKISNSHAYREVFCMPRVCAVCGKGTVAGNRISHSHRKTRRTWSPNFAARSDDHRAPQDGKRMHPLLAFRQMYSGLCDPMSKSAPRCAFFIYPQMQRMPAIKSPPPRRSDPAQNGMKQSSTITPTAINRMPKAFLNPWPPHRPRIALSPFIPSYGQQRGDILYPCGSGIRTRFTNTKALPW